MKRMAAWTRGAIPPTDCGLKSHRGWATSLPPNGAQVAQLVEHATENRSVGGSIPLLGTISNHVSAP